MRHDALRPNPVPHSAATGVPCKLRRRASPGGKVEEAAEFGKGYQKEACLLRVYSVP